VFIWRTLDDHHAFDDAYTQALTDAVMSTAGSTTAENSRSRAPSIARASSVHARDVGEVIRARRGTLQCKMRQRPR
jgi:hypothetical protein